MTTDNFADKLQLAVARHIGAPGTIHDLQRLTGGANKTTWSFDADVGDRQRFILQMSSIPLTAEPDPLAGVSPHLTAEEDAAFIRAAVKAGVPAPHVRAVLEPADGLGSGYVTERVDGETLAGRIPLADAPFLKRFDPAEMVAAQRKILEYRGLHLPALECGLRWAAENAPKNPRVTCVHGDFRLGNFIVGEEGIRLLLDWEIGQAGDPMQDLAWVCVKTWRFGGPKPVGGFGTREELFAAYERASGHRVDPAQVRFWEAFGSVKWAVGCLGLGTRGVEEMNVERCAIGRRIEEPLWDFYNLIEGRD